MRKTLAGIGALSLTALSFAYCSSDNNTGGTVDMAAPSADLTGSGSDPDLSTTADQATTTDQATGDMPAPAAPAEFVVLRIGADNRAAALTNDATAGFLERRKFSDGSLVGTALALPIAANGTDKQLTFSGTASNEGQLSRTPDGKYLVVAGYAANPGVANVSTSAITTTNRVVGRITAANVIDTKTAFAFFPNGVRGVTAITTMDGADLWIASQDGIGYTKFGTQTVPTSLSIINSRGIELFKQNNVMQLFATTNTTTNPGVNTVGTGTPTTALQTMTKLNGFTTGNSPSPYGFLAFDRDNNGSIDQIYIADDTIVDKGGVQRWKLSNNAWTLDGTIAVGGVAGARAVTGYFVNGQTGPVTLVATTTDARSRVVKIVDNGGATSGLTAEAISTAAVNNTYRGIALAPQ